MNKQVLLLLAFASSIVSLHVLGNLTHQEQWQLLQKSSLPLALRPLGEAVAGFLTDPAVRDFFITRARLPVYAAQIINYKGNYAGGFTEQQRQMVQAQEAAYAAEYDHHWQPLLNDILQRYDARLLGTDSQRPSNTFYLTMPAFDGYVLKMRKIDWIDNDDLIPSRYQLISRVLYRHEINAVIDELNLDRIIKVNEYLVPIPGVWGISVDDDHYAVLTEPLPPLPTPEENKARWQTVRDADGAVLDADKQIALEQLERLAQRVGLWTFGYHKVFLLQNDSGKWHILLVDVEKPGINGGLDRNFYHKDPAEVQRNWEGRTNGRDSLAKMLQRPSASSSSAAAATTVPAPTTPQSQQ